LFVCLFFFSPILFVWSLWIWEMTECCELP
jgi:hypothetical protein